MLAKVRKRPEVGQKAQESQVLKQVGATFNQILALLHQPAKQGQLLQQAQSLIRENSQSTCLRIYLQALATCRPACAAQFQGEFRIIGIIAKVFGKELLDSIDIPANLQLTVKRLYREFFRRIDGCDSDQTVYVTVFSSAAAYALNLVMQSTLEDWDNAKKTKFIFHPIVGSDLILDLIGSGDNLNSQQAAAKILLFFLK